MPSCTILYHYYYPDDVVSARHIADFAEGIASRGWDVHVFTSRHYCRRPGKIGLTREVHNSVAIRRFGHPPFSQANMFGRLFNSLFLSTQWFFALLFCRTDVVVFGTDPQFAFYIIPFVKLFRPKLPIGIWGFDLYPEAIFADGIRVPRFIQKLLRFWGGVSYRRCDLLVDIGSCMRKRFEAYQPTARLETIVPWALDESQHA
jgi:hypothetical protein